jgi:putative Mg2+ transporter-C (MgtC) family protein
MATPTDAEFVLRLLLATGCGAVIGLERQYRSRTAGLRTHALVAAGAAAFVLFGEQAGVPMGPVRIAAYVVSGVGFLGGGVILRQGFAVQGLNTAATLWCSAAVGCQAAGGHLLPALALTAIVVSVHMVLRPLGRLLDKVPASKSESVGLYTVLVRARRDNETHLRALIMQALSKQDAIVCGLATRTIDDNGSRAAATVELRVQLEVEGRPDPVLDGLVNRLSLEPGVRAISWQADDDEPSGDDELAAGWRRLWHREAARAD